MEEEVKNKKNKIIEKNNIKDNNIEESNTIDKNDNNNEIINEKNNKDKYNNKYKKENDKDNITEENNDINNNENNIINGNNNIIVEENNHININYNEKNNIDVYKKNIDVYNNEKDNEKNNDDDYDIINENININEEIGNKNYEKKMKETKVINKTKEKKIYENQIKHADLKEKKNQEDYENNNKIINDNNINVNELLKRIKKLEEENKKLKNENKDLKEQISQMNNYNEEKLKKTEKEKENLKIELQKLKNLLNPKNAEENNRNNKNESNINKRQNTMPVISNFDLYKPKNDMKENHDKFDLKNNYINNIKNNTMQNKEKKNHNKINFDSKPPINLKVYKTLTQSSYIRYSLDNCFAAFTTLNDELLLVYSTKFKSLECFDLIKQKYIKTILNAHNGIITTIRHYCPQKINKDLILTGSNGDYCAKIWDIETWECIFNLNKIYSKGNMYSICILFDQYQKETLLFTSSDSDYVKIWGINGNLIKNINKTNNNEVYLVDTYYDNKEYKYYLITGEMKCVRTYDLNTHQLFRTYSDNNSFSEHVCAFIYTPAKVAGLTKLVESEFYGSVRIWNFHNGNMIKKMDICRRIPLISMCLWNENYLLVSCADNTIKLIDFKNNVFIKSFSGHNNEVCTIQKIIHPTHGECLISQGLANEQIKMWING